MTQLAAHHLRRESLLARLVVVDVANIVLEYLDEDLNHTVPRLKPLPKPKQQNFTDDTWKERLEKQESQDSDSDSTWQEHCYVKPNVTSLWKYQHGYVKCLLQNTLHIPNMAVFRSASLSVHGIAVAEQYKLV